ncbi:hypothetical protein [Nitrosomonas oligotropha]|uniref:hypothetical protein n=1 Tax=Nitrosomonas oligotropha TaxID=42354 RepID=UPI001369CF06|nr:hypothetical protein [Nitrosomonas oligotropha]MXS81556.1 hypothetical protein [Nitrosomonas oligotropha]
MGIEKKEIAHTTDQELKFIDKLGFFSECELTRKQLLINYIAAAEKRTDWGGIVRDMVVGYAHGCLAKLV